MVYPLGQTRFPPLAVLVLPLAVLVLVCALFASAFGEEGTEDADREARGMDRFAEGQLFEASGRFVEALAAYEDAEKDLDPSPTLYIHLARTSWHVSDFDRTRRYAARAVELNGKNAEAHFLLGSACYRTGDPDRALASLENAAAIDSLDLRYGQTLAAVYESADRIPDAIDVYERLKIYHPYAPQLRVKLGTLYVTSDDLDRAIQNFESAREDDESFPGLLPQLGAAYDQAGRLPEAVDAYRLALDRTPNDFGTRRRLVDVLAIDGQLDAAYLEVRTLRYMLPEQPDVLHRYATLAYGTGRADEAIEALERLEGLGALGPEHETMRAEIHLRAGDDEAASRAAESALERAPGDLRARLIAARAAGNLGDEDRAASHLEHARELAPDDRDVSLTYALFLAGAGDTDRAIQTLASTAEDRPEDPEILFPLGVLLEQSERFEESVEILRRVVTLAPRHHRAMNHLGYLFAERGENLDEAESLVRRALELDPDNAAYLDSMGWVLVQKGDPAGGRSWLERAADGSEDPVILEHLGDCLLLEGRPGAAIGPFERALAAGGEPAGLEQKLSRARGGAGEGSPPAELPSDRGVSEREEARP